LLKTSLSIIKVHKIYGRYYSKDMPMVPIMRIIVTNNTAIVTAVNIPIDASQV
jgi:hypothetical protein